MSFSSQKLLLTRGALIADAATSVAKHEVGTTVTDKNGNVFMYIKSADNVTITAGQALVLAVTGAAPCTTTIANLCEGCQVGVAMVAATAGGSGTYNYLWVQVKTGAGQTASLLVAASAAAGAGLQSTATAGQLDDASTTSIVGIALTTSQGAGGAGVNTSAILNFPYVAATFA